MQGTRDRILEYVIQHRETRVEGLADELGITTAAVRRHLDNLRADGLVDARTIRQATGRPYYGYFATEKATQGVPPAYADLQVARVAQARRATPEAIRQLVAAHTEGRALGVMGEPVVNVVALNLALDQTFPTKS